MEPQDELQQLLDRQEALKQELAARKKELQEAQRRQRTTLTRQIRRAQARVSSVDRKRRTRRLILIGSYVDSVSQADQEAMMRLMKGLDKFLERDQDRALFDLAPREDSDKRAAIELDRIPGAREAHDYIEIEPVRQAFYELLRLALKLGLKVHPSPHGNVRYAFSFGANTHPSCRVTKSWLAFYRDPDSWNKIESVSSVTSDLFSGVS